jgi:hypothetical protein
VTDLLLRQAQAGRAGAQGDNDYDVIGPDGLVIGRIFNCDYIAWDLDVDAGLRGSRERTLTHGYEATRQAAMQAFAKSWQRE